jgi:rare lipoprotein A
LKKRTKKLLSLACSFPLTLFGSEIRGEGKRFLLLFFKKEAFLLLLMAAAPAPQEDAKKLAQEPPLPPPPAHTISIDHTGRKQTGKASVYADHFQGRHMADGHRFSHRGDAAASKTLPIGTVAKVTNLSTGDTAVVKIRDHGPFVRGRTLDVSRATAHQLGIDRHTGVAPVIVAPVTVPQPDGTVKTGAGALPGPATAQ